MEAELIAHQQAGERMQGRWQHAIRLEWLLLPTLVLYALAFVLPLVVLIGESFSTSLATTALARSSLTFDNYRAFASDGVTLRVFLTTVRLAALITMACVVLGYPLALFLRRVGPRLRIVVLALVVSPLLTSVIVRNVGWLLILGREGLVNAALRGAGVIDSPLPLLYNTFGVVLGVTHVYLAFLVLPLLASLTAIDPSVEESASSLGAPPWRVFLHVTLPLSLPGIIAGATLVFILSMGVYLTPVIMGGGFVNTLPMIITDLVRNQYDWSRASAFAVVLLIFVGAILVLSQDIQRRLTPARAEERVR
jgi:putative spermidine/putrescine transport system permease protein